MIQMKSYFKFDKFQAMFVISNNTHFHILHFLLLFFITIYFQPSNCLFNLILQLVYIYINYLLETIYQINLNLKKIL